MKYVFIDPIDSSIEYQTTCKFDATDYITDPFFQTPLIMQTFDAHNNLIDETLYHARPKNLN